MLTVGQLTCPADDLFGFQFHPRPASGLSPFPFAPLTAASGIVIQVSLDDAEMPLRPNIPD